MKSSPDTRKVVLIVEDHDPSRYIAGHVLSAAGYEIVEAANGSEALKHAALADVIILDVHLPDMSGYEICQRLKADERTAHIPVIFTTAAATDPLAVRFGKQLGAAAYLCSKPIDGEILISTVETAIRGA